MTSRNGNRLSDTKVPVKIHIVCVYSARMAGMPKTRRRWYTLFQYFGSQRNKYASRCLCPRKRTPGVAIFLRSAQKRRGGISIYVSPYMKGACRLPPSFLCCAPVLFSNFNVSPSCSRRHMRVIHITPLYYALFRVVWRASAGGDCVARWLSIMGNFSPSSERQRVMKNI